MSDGILLDPYLRRWASEYVFKGHDPSQVSYWMQPSVTGIAPGGVQWDPDPQTDVTEFLTAPIHGDNTEGCGTLDIDFDWGPEIINFHPSYMWHVEWYLGDAYPHKMVNVRPFDNFGPPVGDFPPYQPMDFGTGSYLKISPTLFIPETQGNRLKGIYTVPPHTNLDIYGAVTYTPYPEAIYKLTWRYYGACGFRLVMDAPGGSGTNHNR